MKNLAVLPLVGAALQRVEGYLAKATPRPLQDDESSEYLIVVRDASGALHLIEGATQAILARTKRDLAVVYGMVDPRDGRAPWDQVTILEASPKLESSSADGGGFIFAPFFVKPDPGKLRDRLYVVVAETPERPMNGARQQLNLPRLLLADKVREEAERAIKDAACSVLRALAGTDGTVCKRRLTLLGPGTSPTDTFWDLAKLAEGAGIKYAGYRFNPDEVQLPDAVVPGVDEYVLRSEVLESDEVELKHRAAWATWRFQRYSQIKTRSGMTLVGLKLLFDYLDDLDV